VAYRPAITTGGRTRQVAWAEETIQLKDYGQARKITLFEHGQVAMQILTSDTTACQADILSWLRSRWSEENFLKYASENYGTGKICDYVATTGTNTKITGNPGPQDRPGRGPRRRGRPRPRPGRPRRHAPRPRHPGRRQEHQAHPRRPEEHHHSRTPARQNPGRPR
jgi:hypothetical protein